MQLTHLIRWGGPLYGRHPHRQQHEVAYGALGPTKSTANDRWGHNLQVLQILQKSRPWWRHPARNRISINIIIPVHWHPPFCAIIIELLQHYDWRWPGPEEAARQSRNTCSVNVIDYNVASNKRYVIVAPEGQTSVIHRAIKSVYYFIIITYARICFTMALRLPVSLWCVAR